MNQDNLFHLPSVRKFLSDVHDNLNRGYSQIIVAPPRFDCGGLRNHIKQLISRDDLSVFELDLRNNEFLCQDSYSLVSSIANSAPVSNDSDLEKAITNASFPDVTIVTGLSSLNKEQRTSICYAVKDFSDWLRRYKDESSLSVLIVDEARNLIGCTPSNDVLFSVRYMWGFPSPSELRVLSDVGYEGSSRFDKAWQASLVTGLTGGDPSVFALITDNSPTNTEEVLTILKNSSQNQPQMENQDMAINLPKKIVQGAPPPGLMDRWAKGEVIGDVEYGVELHPYQLANTDQKADISQRIWRGQAQVVLPMIDHFRIRAARDIQRHGSKNIHKWFEKFPQAFQPTGEQLDRLKEDPLDAELSYLDRLSNDSNGERRFFGSETRRWGRWTNHIGFVRKIRNSFAHYNALDKPRFTQLLYRIEESF